MGISVEVEFTGQDFVASFDFVNLHASGDSEREAIENLRDIIEATWETLRSIPEEELGPEPKRQLDRLNLLFQRM
jgi:predicted RNase H-like HicB family nuclease